MKNIIITTVLAVVLLFGGMAVKVLLFPVNTVGHSIDMAYGVVDKTLDADNAIYNYEWFKQQEADIRKCLENEQITQDEYDLYVNTLPNDSSAWSHFQQQEESSLRNSLTALKKITNNAIEDYNAKASMVNRNIFNDNLPSNITRAIYVGVELAK